MTEAPKDFCDNLIASPFLSKSLSPGVQEKAWVIKGLKYAGSYRVKKMSFEDMILSPIILIGTFSCFLPPSLPQKMNAAVTKGSF